MILRTPPASKRSRGPDAKLPESPRVGSDNQLAIYEDPILMPVESTQEPAVHSEHMLCTYQCRQMVKADFIDALSKAESQVQDYHSKFEQLNENLRKAECERKRFLDQFLYTEQELAAAKGREKALQDQILKEVVDCKERLKKQIDITSELEVKLQNERKLRSKAESNAASAEEKANSLELKLNHLCESIDREKKRVNDEYTLLKSESKLSLTRITADLEKMEFRAKSAEKDAELLKEHLEHLQKQFNECMAQKSEVEKKLSNFTFQEVDSTDSSIVVKHLQEELRNYESEVREARKLKSSHQNIELLKEKLIEEKNRREKAELELPKLQEVQQNMNKLEEQLSSWTLIMKGIPGVSCFEEIPMKFAALQEEVFDSTRKEGELNCCIKKLQVALDEAQINQKNAETEAALARERAEILKSEIKRNEAMLDVVSKEKDELRNFINELKLKSDGAGDVPCGIDVQDLESLLSKKECHVKELESNLVEQKELNNCQHEEIKSLNERLNHEAKRVKSLERESDRLRSEISLLEAKLGHGDYSATNTKVLRMVNTLAVDNEAKKTIDALHSELQKTKEKLQAIEELKSQSGDAGKLLDSYISGKISQLKEQIATLEKREERYKTVFADRISVFRRACCELFGYKIVMDEHQRPNGIPVTRFTLQSIYAQTDDEKLEFEYESGNTNIMVNDYTSQAEISRQVDIFIRKMHSIPAFTANLTVESFNRRTLS